MWQPSMAEEWSCSFKVLHFHALLQGAFLQDYLPFAVFSVVKITSFRVICLINFYPFFFFSHAGLTLTAIIVPIFIVLCLFLFSGICICAALRK